MPSPKKGYPWSEIRREYIVNGISGQKLSEKYDVPLSTLKRKASREGWERSREDKGIAVETVKVQHDLTVAQLCAKIGETMITKVASSIDKLDDEDRTGMKQMSSIIRDLKEVKLWVDDLDRAEQMARIKKLQHDAEDTHADVDIHIKFEQIDEELGG